MYWQHALTPLHVGVGRGIGFIDLPIIREKLTNWPYVPGSAVKGVLADHHEATEDAREVGPLLGAAFGRSKDPEKTSAGSLVFTDARLVCLPVRSLYGTFAWTTCPMALGRLARDLNRAALPDIPGIPREPPERGLVVPNVQHSQLVADGDVFFEDLDLSAEEQADAAAWADKLAGWVFEDGWQSLFQQRFAVVADDVFTFLCQTATEVNARVKIAEKTKTVEHGALWYEEAIPAETILAGYVWCDRVYVKGVQEPQLWGAFCKPDCPLTLQMGGDATTGKGRVESRFTNGGTTNA